MTLFRPSTIPRNTMRKKLSQLSQIASLKEGLQKTTKDSQFSWCNVLWSLHIRLSFH